VWDFSGDYTVRSPNDFASLKTGYGLRIYDQNRLERYDIVQNVFVLQPNLKFEKLLATFPANYGHYIVGDHSYLSAASAGNVNNIMLGRSTMAQVGAVYNAKDYLTAINDDEDRSGNEIVGLGGIFWFFANNEGFLNLRCGVNKDWTNGKNWEHWGNKFGASLLVPFWEKFRFNTQGELALQFYDNNHTVFGNERRDQKYSLSTLLTYEIFKNSEIHFQYTYVNNRSKISLYEYDRHILSTSVLLKF
jgi:hypothetical protein